MLHDDKVICLLTRLHLYHVLSQQAAPAVSYQYMGMFHLGPGEQPDGTLGAPVPGGFVIRTALEIARRQGHYGPGIFTGQVSVSSSHLLS